MFPLFNTDGTSTCPMGFPMCQNRMAVPTWSYAMEVHRPARIIELGSYNGGFTIAIGVHAYRIGAKLTSYERSVAPDESFAALGKFLGITFRHSIDMWSCMAEIATLVRAPGVSYVLCDGGDKARELMTFAAFLKPGDVIAGHDYNCMIENPVEGVSPYWPWSELSAEAGRAAAAAHGLEPFMQEHFDVAGWLAFKKR